MYCMQSLSTSKVSLLKILLMSSVSFLNLSSSYFDHCPNPPDLYVHFGELGRVSSFHPEGVAIGSNSLQSCERVTFGHVSGMRSGE